jgi:2-oxoglutarate ferredoxin oxidoreductase subunit delta
MSTRETAKADRDPSSEDSPAAEVAEKGTKKAPSSRPRGYVTIFGTWCKGCGLCIEFCPQHVIEANGHGRTHVAHGERCTACHWCDTHCPDMAITVRRLEPDELREIEGVEKTRTVDAKSSGTLSSADGAGEPHGGKDPQPDQEGGAL